MKDPTCTSSQLRRSKRGERNWWLMRILFIGNLSAV